jgi:hypothetical protein
MKILSKENSYLKDENTKSTLISLKGMSSNVLKFKLSSFWFEVLL